jgi:hypothetical protein
LTACMNRSASSAVSLAVIFTDTTTPTLTRLRRSLA